MFKSARWRSDKNKIKAVFKLQFQATQVAQLGVDGLMISLIPVDVGKPTVKLGKAAVQDGTCCWQNAIYETVKFIEEPRTGKFKEKIYKFLVSTGSSKAGFQGEVHIDFADYAEAVKPSSISLPLTTSNSGAVLHVTIQRIQGEVDQREIEGNGDAKIKTRDRSLKSQLSNCDMDDNSNSNCIEDGPYEITAPNAESDGNIKASSSSDATLVSGSEDSSGLNTPRDFGLNNDDVHQDHNSFLSSHGHSSMSQGTTANAAVLNNHDHQRSNTECSVGSAPDVSTDDSINSSEDTFPKDRSPNASNVSIEKLKSDLVVLARQAEVSDLELQTLRKQIVKESKRGQDLSREVVGLKEERDALRKECEQLKASQRRIDEAKTTRKLQFEGEDPWVVLEEIRQELNYEKDQNSNLRLQLHKTQESNSELILAVQDLHEMLEQKDREIPNLSNKTKIDAIAVDVQEKILEHDMFEDEEQKALEELVKEHDDTKEINVLEQKIIGLHSEIEFYRRDRDELEMQMEQLALDYEILKQENHEISSKLEQIQLQEQLKMQYESSGPLESISELENQIESLEQELQKKEKEFSIYLATISEHETQIETLEKELEKQAEEFKADLEAVTRGKIEQEQRAIRAEEALRKTRWNNANKAEQLQEEFRRLSIQMASMFDTNEKLATEALTEASELRRQKIHLEDMLKNANEELTLAKDQYEAQLQEFSNQIKLKTKQIEQLLLEVENKSKQLERQQKHEEERDAILSKEILMLRAEIENLTREKNEFYKPEQDMLRTELEQMKTSINEKEMLLQKGNKEKDELERSIASVMDEAKELLEQLNSMRYLKVEKETMVGVSRSEVETLRAQYNDLKHSLFENELEKENLRKQIFHLKTDQRKKEEITSLEKKVKDSSGRAILSDGAKANSRNKCAQVPRGSKEASLREKIKLLEGQIKQKEAALEKSANSFLEKERDLHRKIEELERRMEELNHNSICKEQFEMGTTNAGTANATRLDEGRTSAETLLDSEMIAKTCTSDKRNRSETFSEEEMEVSTFHISDQGELAEFLAAMTLLKETNKSMEGELKEMQERYSELSLKFAEVEGERQQLVMTVRNLKNAKKN